MNSISIFITGTDTGVGKTLITGLLARYFLSEGINMITQKWIQTGCTGNSADIEDHLKLNGNVSDIYKDLYSHVAPYVLSYPASPHLAARIDNVNIDKTRIIDSLNHLKSLFDVVLIEGSGGVLVPYNETELMIDIVVDINMPVILVAENRLGAINQTLLSIEAIRARGLFLHGIIFNNPANSDNDLLLEDNINIIERLSGVSILGQVPYLHDTNKTADIFKLIGDNIISSFNIQTGVPRPRN